MKEELQAIVDKLNEEYGYEIIKLIFEEDKVYFIGEFYYEEGMKYADKLDKIIQKYYKDAYFDAECEGRFVAYLY